MFATHATHLLSSAIMVNCHISRDVKVAAMRLYEQNLLGLSDILDTYGFSQRTFYHVLKLWHTTGNVVSYSNGIRGQKRLLDQEDLDYLLELICASPDLFVDELLTLLEKNWFISVHYTTIY